MNQEELDWRVGLGKRLDKLDSCLGRLMERQDSQDEKLEAMGEWFQLWDGAMRFFGFLNKIMKPILSIIGTAAVAWTAWKTFK